MSLHERRERLRVSRLSPHKAKGVMTTIKQHYIEQVGPELGMAYGLLDDACWPMGRLTLKKLWSLDLFERFLTPLTGRLGVKVRGGILLVRGDGTVEERQDVHEAMVVLA